MTTSSYTRQEAAKLAAIQQHKRYTDQLHIRYEMARRKADLCKRQWQHAMNETMELIDKDASQLNLPGMEDLDEPLPIPTWKETPIDVVIDDAKVIIKFHEWGVRTLGDLDAKTKVGTPLTSLGLTELEEHRVVEALKIYWQDEPGSEDEE